jgi:hypothetical protein
MGEMVGKKKRDKEITIETKMCLDLENKFLKKYVGNSFTQLVNNKPMSSLISLPPSFSCVCFHEHTHTHRRII